MEQFIKLNSISSNLDSLLSFAKSPDTVWRNKNAFDLVVVPNSLLTDNILLNLMDRFKPVPVIFRMKPWQFYRFHIDETRSCALNLFLEGADSNTYYGTNTENEEVLDIKELCYLDNHYYLLNTKRKHAVINRNNVRYMFSMGFYQHVVDYDTVKNYCLENNL